MEGLIQVVQLNYEHMGKYLPRLQQVTQDLIRQASEDEESKKVAHYSIEIWNTICEVELELLRDPAKRHTCLNMIQGYNWSGLASIFFNGL